MSDYAHCNENGYPTLKHLLEETEWEIEWTHKTETDYLVEAYDLHFPEGTITIPIFTQKKEKHQEINDL